MINEYIETWIILSQNWHPFPESKQKGEQTHNIVHEGAIIALLHAYHCSLVVEYRRKINEVTIVSLI